MEIFPHYGKIDNENPPPRSAKLAKFGPRHAWVSTYKLLNINVFRYKIRL